MAQAKKKTGITGIDNKSIQKTKLVDKDIQKNLQYIKKQAGENSDLAFRQIPLSTGEDSMGYLVYLKTSIDMNTLDVNILKPLISKCSEEYDYERILKEIPMAHITQTTDLNLSIREIFKSTVLLLIQNNTNVYLITAENDKNRQIEEPSTERTLRGSREGFVENIDTNIYLVRRKLPDPKLVAEEVSVGLRTMTRIAILYVKDIADGGILEELRNRIGKIKIDGITAAGMLEQLIEDSYTSVFPQFQNTEKPDKVVQSLLEGRICILCNGSPVALLLPAVFVNFLSASEDYYERTIVGTFNRFLRYSAFFIVITLPSMYIALTSFHPELIPFNLIIPLAKARKEIPFPPIIEAFLLEITVEFLREMGLRLPEPVGNTLGVVGGIVLGDAAIRANLVSPAMVIVVGVTAIISFTIPNFSMVLALRLLRFAMMLMAGVFGAFGITIGWLFILAHLIRLESFSIPYLSPFAPIRQEDIKDTFFRAHLWKMKYRPEFLHTKDRIRQNSNRKRGRGNG